MANSPATLTYEGALQVSNRNMVTNLNAEMVGGTSEDKLLRTDINRNVTGNGKITVKDEGSIQVDASGLFKVGPCIFRSTQTGLSIGFN